MERTSKILRTSIHTFLKYFQYFTTTAALLAFPFSVSILLSLTLALPTIHSHIQSLFDAAGFPPSSQFFAILNLKLSQTITSSILVLPFSLYFLLITKAYVIQFLNDQRESSPQTQISSLISLYRPLFFTQLCNLFLILSANATCFSLLVVAFSCLDGFNLSSPVSLLFLSATAAVLYSVVLANALIICNLALVLSGMEKCGGCIAILKACVMIRGRTATALLLALPISIALAGVEALFQYRVVRAYYNAKNPISSTVLEGMFIAYLYSILVVLDTITMCVFFKSCKTVFRIDQEGMYSYLIKIEEDDDSDVGNVKSFHEFLCKC